MTRPVTLFTGQWADLPFEDICTKAGAWGYDGLEIACWGDHMEVRKAASDTGYVEEKKKTLEKHKLKCWALGAHLDFTIKGSLKIGEIGGFSWEDSKVIRDYDVIGQPNTELILGKEEKTIWQGKTDENGKVSFSIKFNDANFSDSWKLRDNLGNHVKIQFFSATPIKLPLH